jgi:hypothetical protein
MLVVRMVSSRSRFAGKGCSITPRVDGALNRATVEARGRSFAFSGTPDAFPWEFHQVSAGRVVVEEPEEAEEEIIGGLGACERVERNDAGSMHVRISDVPLPPTFCRRQGLLLELGGRDEVIAVEATAEDEGKDGTGRGEHFTDLAGLRIDGNL